MLGKRFLSLFLCFIILGLPMVSSLEFTLNSISRTKNADYETDYASYQGSITYQGKTCETTCQVVVSSNSNSGNSDTDSFTCLDDTCPFTFSLDAEPGRNSVSWSLEIECHNYASIWPVCIASSAPKQYDSNSFSYAFNGNNICETSYENCQTASSDCSCSSNERCELISSRADSKGCATYCGNGVAESVENCNSCPSDVGKCDGVSCTSDSDCEGYCVNNVCWNQPYKDADGICNTDKGENCKTSPTDCGCSAGERCESGICKTYCGNSICETNENCALCSLDCGCATGFSCSSGNCEEDVACGDSVCSNDESCTSCSIDCGDCPGQEEVTDTSSSSESYYEELDSSSSSTEESQEEIKGDSSESSILNTLKKPAVNVPIILLIAVTLWYFGIKKYVKNKKINKGLLHLCHKCGKHLQIGNSFCMHCGAKKKT